MTSRGPRFFAVAHLKGGTGATSIAVNLAAGLALKGRRVVLLDLDPVGAATFHLTAEHPTHTLAEALENRLRLEAVLVNSAADRLRLAPASRTLTAWDRRPERFPVDLARVFEQTPAEVDEVVIDLPPSNGAIVRGTLAVLPGGRVLAPVQARALDLIGFGDLLQLVEELQDQNAALHLAGVVPARVNRTSLAAEVVDALQHEHRDKVLPAIREAVAVARAPLTHKPLQLAAPRSPAVDDFNALTEAVLRLPREAHD